MSDTSNNSKILMVIVALCIIGLLVYFGKSMLFKEEVSAPSPIVQTEKTAKSAISTGTFVDERDAQVYNWIQFGEDKKWMAQNLNFKTKGSWCYNNKPNCKRLGRLYNWNSAVRACPKGWHLPELDEWNALINQFDNPSQAFIKLTQEDLGHFGVEFGGARSSQKQFNFLNENANFWTSSQSKNPLKWHVNFSKSLSKVFTLAEKKEIAFSCRCVEGESEKSKEYAQVKSKSSHEKSALKTSANSSDSKQYAQRNKQSSISGQVFMEIFDESSESFKPMRLSKLGFSADQIIQKPNSKSSQSLNRFTSENLYASSSEYRLQVSGNAETYVFSLEENNQVYGLYPLKGSPSLSASNDNSMEFSGDMIVSKPGASDDSSPEAQVRQTSNNLMLTNKLKRTESAEESKVVILSRIPLDIKNIMRKMEQQSTPKDPEARLIHILNTLGYTKGSSNLEAIGDRVSYTLGNEKFSILPMIFVIKRS